MRYQVTASALNLRSGPGTDYPVRDVLPRGTHVDSIADGWVYVQVGGRQGWVSSQYLSIPEPEPHWMTIARDELGVTEVPGRDHNARIIEYHSVTTLRATDDETPWCSSYVSWVLEQAGVRSTRSAASRSYLKWGREIEHPIPGCIVVLRRGAPPSGHVGFYVRSDGNRIVLLGGNQSNRVCEQSYPISDVIGYRMPLEASAAA